LVSTGKIYIVTNFDPIQVKADSRDEVDKAYFELKKIGATIGSEPKIYPEYSKNYYALYFKDNENIKYEIV